MNKVFKTKLCIIHNMWILLEVYVDANARTYKARFHYMLQWKINSTTKTPPTTPPSSHPPLSLKLLHIRHSFFPLDRRCSMVSPVPPSPSHPPLQLYTIRSFHHQHLPCLHCFCFAGKPPPFCLCYGLALPPSGSLDIYSKASLSGEEQGFSINTAGVSC